MRSQPLILTELQPVQSLVVDCYSTGVSRSVTAVVSDKPEEKSLLLGSSLFLRVLWFLPAECGQFDGRPCPEWFCRHQRHSSFPSISRHGMG